MARNTATTDTAHSDTVHSDTAPLGRQIRWRRRDEARYTGSLILDQARREASAAADDESRRDDPPMRVWHKGHFRRG